MSEMSEVYPRSMVKSSRRSPENKGVEGVTGMPLSAVPFVVLVRASLL